MEGVWQTERGAPLLLFALPNEETRSNDFALGIPNLASLILTHDMNGKLLDLMPSRQIIPRRTAVFWFSRHGGSGRADAVGQLVWRLACMA